MLIEPVQPVCQMPLLVEFAKGIEQGRLVEFHLILCCRDEKNLVDNQPTLKVFRGFHPPNNFEEGGNWKRIRFGIPRRFKDEKARFREVL